MARRLIIDTGVLVSLERGRRAGLTDVLTNEDDVVIAAVTVAELRAGVELASKPHRTARAHFLAQVLRVIPVEPYQVATADEHGRLLAHVARTSTQRGAHDLVVAATAIVTGRTVVSTDRRARFAELPGVACLLVGPEPV